MNTKFIAILCAAFPLTTACSAEPKTKDETSKTEQSVTTNVDDKTALAQNAAVPKTSITEQKDVATPKAEKESPPPVKHENPKIQALFDQVKQMSAQVPETWEIYGFRPGMTRDEFIAAAKERGADVSRAIPNSPSLGFGSENPKLLVSAEFFENVATDITINRLFEAGTQIDPNLLKADVIEKFGEGSKDSVMGLEYYTIGIAPNKVKGQCQEEFAANGGNRLKATQLTAAAFNSGRFSHRSLEAIESTCPNTMDNYLIFAASQLSPRVSVTLPSSSKLVLSFRMGHYGAKQIIRAERELKHQQEQKALPKARL